MRPLVAALLVALGGLGASSSAAAQAVTVHGADSVFAGPDAVIVWAVLRAAVEAETEVVIRVSAAPRFRALSADAVDPFSGVRRPVVAPRPLGGVVEVRRRRAHFADLPRLELHFHRDAGGGAAAEVALTVYFLGVPDTTPEFTTEATLRAYLDESVTRARRGP
jgi:hypothetical protein